MLVSIKFVHLSCTQKQFFEIMNDIKETKDVAVVDKTTDKHELQTPVFSNNVLGVFSPTEMAELEVFLTKYIRSDKAGIKSVQDGIAIAMRAKDLRLPFSTCAEHIHVVNGKTGIDVHVAKALLLKGSVSWECIDDYHALYEYTDGFNAYVEDKLPNGCVKVRSAAEAADKLKDNPDSDNIYVYPVKFYKDYNGNIYKDYQLNSSFGVAVNQAHAQKIASEKKIPVYRVPAVPVDYVTSYKFTRKVGEVTMTSVGKFSYNDAVAANCFDKATYKLYPKVMIGHRAWFYGARDIASDLLMGCMSIDELNQVTGSKIPEDVEVIDITNLQD